MTNSPSDSTNDPGRFVGYLYGLNSRAHKGRSDARGALARLRRALGQTVNYAVLRDIGSALPPQAYIDDYILVAGLFALYQPSPEARPAAISLGGTLKRFRAANPVGSESLDRRMTALLEAHRDDLPYRLRQIVQLLKGTPHQPHWIKLLEHIGHWNHASRYVQRQWAKDYWT